MKIAEFRAIVDQACHTLDLWSPAAVQLVVMTACHESHLQYRRQIGGGPALGLCQMEPATWRDIYDNFLRYQEPLRAKVDALLGGRARDPEAMVENDLYAAAMCRMHYRRVKAPLPRVDDPDALARYWKANYNTAQGKGTEAQFLRSYVQLSIAEVWS